jgi:hypothetical protein
MYYCYVTGNGCVRKTERPLKIPPQGEKAMGTDGVEQFRNLDKVFTKSLSSEM